MCVCVCVCVQTFSLFRSSGNVHIQFFHYLSILTNIFSFIRLNVCMYVCMYVFLAAIRNIQPVFLIPAS